MSKISKFFKPKVFLFELLSILYNKNSTEALSIMYLIINMFQLSGYIYKLHYTEIEDTKILFFLRVFYYSTFTNLLFYLESSLLAYIIFYMILILLHFILLFPIVSVILSKIMNYHIKNRWIYTFLKGVYQKIFEMFVWVLLTPILEMAMNITDCESFSYIIENRDNSQCVIPAYLWLLAAYMCFLASIISLISLWTQTDNNFLDTKNLRMNFNVVSLTVFIVRAVFVIIFPLIYNKSHALVFVFLHISAICSLYDYIVNFPIRNVFLNRQYICFLFCLETFFIVMSIWGLSSLLNQEDLFYIMILLFVIAFKIGKNLHHRLYLKIIASNFSLFGYKNYFLEEIVRLLTTMKKVESHIYLLGIMKTHLKHCKDSKCKLNLKYYKAFENADEDTRTLIINNFIQKLYQVLITEANKSSQNAFLERCILKYTSFLTFFNYNPLKAYYEIQKIMRKHTTTSFLFLLRRKLLLKAMKSAILAEEKEKNLKKSGQESSGESKALDINLFLSVMREKKELELEAHAVFRSKIAFWEKYKDGFQSYDEVIREIRGTALKVRNFEEKLRENIVKASDKSRPLFSYKMLSLVYALLMNDVNRSIRMEDEVESTKKRETLHDINGLGYVSFFQQNLIPLKVSFLTNKGMILEESKTDSLANFFEYEKNEFKMLDLNSLMPSYIAEHHDRFLFWYLNKGKKVKRETQFIDSYGKKKNGLIFPLKIFVGYGFEYNKDFVLQGLMVQASNYDPNVKTLIFDEKGTIQGINSGIWELFQEGSTAELAINEINYLNIFNILPMIEEIFEKNGVLKNKSGSLFIRNQLGVLHIPLNLFDIIDILRMKHKEDIAYSNRMSYYSAGITARSKKSSEKNQSQRSLGSESEKKKGNRSQYLFKLFNTRPNLSIDKKSLLEEKDHGRNLLDKDILDELINLKECTKYKILFDIKTHYYNFGEKPHQKIGIFYLIINKMNSLTTKPTEKPPNINEEVFADADAGMVSEIESGFLQMPPENIASFRHIHNNTLEIEDPNLLNPISSNDSRNMQSSDERKSEEPHINIANIENFQTKSNEKIFFTTNQNLLTMDLNKEKEEVILMDSHSNSQEIQYNKDKPIKDTTDQANLRQEQFSQKASSISTIKKAYSIFNSIETIQKHFPSPLKRLIGSFFWELLLVIIFCILSYTFATDFYNNYYSPLESGLESFSQITNGWCTVTLVATEMELYKRGYINIEGEIKNTLFEIIGRQLNTIKDLSNEERSLSIRFGYQEEFKNAMVKFTETTFYTTSEESFVDVLDQIMAGLIDIQIATLDEQSLKTLEVFPLNFGYVVDNLNTILDSITAEFLNSNQGITQNLLVTMLILIICLLPLKLFQLAEINYFYQILLKLLNIFLRVSQKNAFNEFLFQKNEFDKIFNPQENKENSYLFMCFPEKIINKKDLEFVGNNADDQENSSHREKKKKQKTRSNKFSFHNLRSLSLFRIKFLLFFSFIVGFCYFFFIYYNWTVINQKINDLIGIHIFFYNFFNMPSHVFALNLLKIREKIVFIPELENSGEIRQTTANRMDYFNSEFLDHVSQLESFASKFPTYLLEVQTQLNDPFFDSMILSNICETLGSIGLFNSEEIIICESILNGAFEQGVMSAMNQILNNMKTQNELIQTSNKDQLIIFLKREDNIDNVYAEHFFEETLLKIFTYLTYYYTDLIVQEISNLKTMIIIFTVGVSILTLCIALFYKNKFWGLYRDMSFCLSLIPYEKLINDEQTVFLIKKFIK